MADLKISQLSSATALAGTEVVPVVQGGSTKKATIDQILAPASGKGIDFAAAGGDTLTIYDEGTWTVTWVGLTGTPSNTTGQYTRVGRLVFFTYAAGANSITGVAGSTYFLLPITPAQYAAGSMISQTAANGGQMDIEITGVSYPTSFSGIYMVFSGVYHV